MNIKYLILSVSFSIVSSFSSYAVYDDQSGNPYLGESYVNESMAYGEGYSDGYDDGNYDGYESGKSEGYYEGESEGYDSGYDEGYEKGASDTEERLDFDYRLIIGVGLFFIMVYDYGKSRER